MKFGKLLLSTLLCSMLAMNLPLVASASPVAHTAELELVRNVVAMTGQKMTSDEAQAQLATKLNQYQASAVKDGQQDVRFVQALVDANVYSQAQAQALFADALTSSTQAVSQGASDSLIANQMAHLAQSHLSGAQFSACGAVGGTFLVGGIAAVITGVVLSHPGSACAQATDSGSSGSTCISTNNSESGNHDLTRDLYIGGAIGMAAGVILLISAAAGC